MSAILKTDAQGRPLVEVADHRGEIWQYTLAITLTADSARFNLTKQVGEDAPEYAVEWRPGAWRCSCKDFHFRPAVRLDGCKHIQACKSILTLLQHCG